MPKSFLVLTPQMVRFNSEKNMKTRKYSLASLLLFSNDEVHYLNVVTLNMPVLVVIKN